MGIIDFEARNGGDVSRSAEALADRWEKERALDSVLQQSIAGDVTLADVLTGGGLNDQVPAQVIESAQSLMGAQADTYAEVRELILAKIESGPDSVQGFVSMLKGRIGEQWFADAARDAGISARLAESGSQQAWDVAVEGAGEATRYVQVKTVADPGSVVQDMREVHAALQGAEPITDGGKIVASIDFAVPDTIYGEVQAQAAAEGLPLGVISTDTTPNEAAASVKEAFDNVGPDAVANLLGELAGASAVAASLHTAANAFMLYKEGKTGQAYWSKLARQTGQDAAVTSGALGVGFSLEATLQALGTLPAVPGDVVVFTTTFATRAVLQRVAERGDYVE